MKKKPKMVTVTPAGRKRYIKILARHLLKNKHIIDEHQFWINTTNKDDIEYISGLCAKHPEFFKMVVQELDPKDPMEVGIWKFMSKCIDQNTVYLRLDDDIVWIDKNAIKNIYEYRLSNIRPFLILGNIVNNAVCSHFYQKSGIVPTDWGKVQNRCMDNYGWASGEFAVNLHELFLKMHKENRIDKFKNVNFYHHKSKERFSINAICWFGKDMAKISEINSLVGEEHFLTEIAPKKYNLYHEICSSALFVHYAYHTQRDYIDKHAPHILEKYSKISLLKDKKKSKVVLDLPAPPDHYYTDICFGAESWFNYDKFYRWMVESFDNGSHFVEIGSWTGRSSAFMAVEIWRSGKAISFDCVDTWLGSREHQDSSEFKSGDLYGIFTRNMKKVRGRYRAVRKDSCMAARGYGDGSLDFVFIDGDHEYDGVMADIRAWLPKVRKGGVIAGHDYGSWLGVTRGVHDSFGHDFHQYMGDVWFRVI